MAEEFYRGPQRRDQAGVNIGAVGGPNMAEAIEGNNRRTRSIINGLESLVTLGKGIGNQLQKNVADPATAAAKAKGAKEALAGQESSAGFDMWSGNAQQEAYVDVTAENMVKDMPDYSERWLANNKDIKKPLDEMTPDERASWLGKAREAFFEERKIKDSPYQQKAEQYANEINGKHLDYLNKKSLDLRDAKAQNNITSLVAKTVNAYSGEPQDVDSLMDAEFTKYRQALGDASGEKTKQVVVSGLLQSVMQENPNLNTLKYLKSEEAQKRFGDMEGFDRAVKQADDFSTKAQRSALVKQKAVMENEFYGLVNSGGFASEEAVQRQLDQYPDEVIDQGEKYTLKAKAMKHIKLLQAADTLKPAIAQKQFGIVNSAPQEDLAVAFERNVMPKNMDIDAALTAQGGPNDPETQIQNSFTKWVVDGFNVPNHVKEHLNSPLNVSNTQGWDRRLATYQKMSQRLGPSGVAKLYDTETQANIEEYAAITGDTTLKPEDKKQALMNFMNGTRRDRLTGLSTNAQIRKEIMDKDSDILKDLQSFAAEGGGDTTFNFDVPTDLQPLTTTRSNSDVGINGYAMKSLMGNYSIYRRQNLNEKPEVALRKAKNDFLNQNVWVDWAEKSTYVPREFGENFAERSLQYIRDTGIVARLSVVEGLDPEMIERKITIEPSSDYHSSRKMSIFYNGIEQDQKFTFEQFDKRIGLLDAKERRAIEKEVSDRRNDPEYRKKQQRLQQFQKSLNFFGVPNN